MTTISEAADHGQAIETVAIGGVKVVRAGRRELTEAMVRHSLARRTRALRTVLVFDANAHAMSLRETDPAYRSALDEADIVHADGGLIVLASRLFTRTPISERSCTTDMFADFATAGAAEGLSFYLLGGTEAVNAACAEIVERTYPGLRIAGRRNGYFAPEEEDDVVAEINAANPDVLWVGLGKPLEQTFSARRANDLGAGWIVSCGGCFNYITGHYPRAPLWMRNNSLEWLHRAFTGPRRLIWRYLTTNPHAVWVILKRQFDEMRRAL